MSVKPAFLLSLPRSGSTLLQRLLAAHSKVATAPEPWFLLPPLYALREEGVYSEYGHQTAVRAVAGLQANLPGGRDDYLDAVAAMAGHVYERLSPPGTEIFLDKTPRYGLVVDELLAAFPSATFLLLHRNPLAVLASIVTTFDDGSWRPYRHKQDLYLLAERLMSAVQRNPNAFVTVSYEDLLSEPAPTLQRLTAALGLDWEPQVMTAFASVPVAGNVGDSTGVDAYDRLSTEPLSKWRNELASPIRKMWAHRYLNWLGAERLSQMGYDLEELLEALEDVPNRLSTLPADIGNTLKGAIWSLAEVEIVRAKLKSSSWHEVFTHT